LVLVEVLLYLAQRTIKGGRHYSIRESYKDGDLFRSRELFVLGSNPARYIIYPGGQAFYIDEVVEDSLASLGVEPSADEIEDVFWPFVKPEVRRAIEPFRARGKARGKKAKITPKEEEQIRAQATEFDKRRIHYLRSGRMDQAGLGRMHLKLYGWLSAKSRDEIEQRFMKMERRLDPSELKTYTFVIFDLQRFFTQSWAKRIPQGLSQEKMEAHFLEEICRLNSDSSFWAGEEKVDSLHEYLRRYVVMFFDNPFMEDTFLRDHIREFMDGHRKWRFPERKRTMNLTEASSIFGVAKDVLESMSRRGVVRLFRRMAQKLHPDKGGKHEEFVKLADAYRALLKRKRHK
jgi:hypothetical protein